MGESALLYSITCDRDSCYNSYTNTRVAPCEECEIINIETDEIETTGYDDLTTLDTVSIK